MEARHNILVYSFFKSYSRLIIKRNFSRVVISGTVQAKKLPVILVANHVSWWDGFWAENVNLKIFGKKFYFMMLEDQLRKHWFFNYCGGFSIKKKSRSVIDSINYSVKLLADSANLLLIFPQGKIESAHKKEFKFEKGIEKIIEKTGMGKIQVVFLVNLTDFFSEPKPSLYQYMEEYDRDDVSCTAIEAAYNRFYLECIDAQIKKSE